jgi:hypothetical protein
LPAALAFPEAPPWQQLQPPAAGFFPSAAAVMRAASARNGSFSFGAQQAQVLAFADFPPEQQAQVLVFAPLPFFDCLPEQHAHSVVFEAFFPPFAEAACLPEQHAQEPAFAAFLAGLDAFAVFPEHHEAPPDLAVV